MMDAMSKNLSINEAQMLIHKLIECSDVDTIEKFWLVEIDKLNLTKKDSDSLNRILKLKNEDTDISNVLYGNCLKNGVIENLLKKNWRRLFNNDIIEKYDIYIKNKQITGDKVWVMS